MLLIGIVLIGVCVGQTIQSSISDDKLHDLSSLRTQRDKTAARALKTRALYNAAKARTKTNLLDRSVRSTDGIEDFPEYDFNEDDLSVLYQDPDINFKDGINIPNYRTEGSGRFSNLDLESQNQKGFENFVGTDSDFARGENGVFLGPKVSSNGNTPNEFEESNNLNCGDFFEGQGGALPLGCQRPDDQPNESPTDSSLGMPPFQVYPSTSQTPILIPMQYGVPAMQIPWNQGSSFPNYPLQQFPMQPGYGSQMIFLREPNLNGQKRIPYYYTTPRLQEFSNSSSAVDSRLGAHSHTHSHTYTHTHSKGNQRPIVNILPPPPIVPNVNLHVIQNQESAMHPGFSTPGRIPMPSATVYRPVLPPPFISRGRVNQEQSIRNTVLGRGGGINQDQLIQTFESNNMHPFNMHGSHGSSMHQSQAVFQGGHGHIPVNEVILREEGLELDSPASEFDLDNELGSFPMENIQLNPLPNLPQNFNELSPEQQREAIQNYLEDEQTNVKDFLERIDENNRRNLQMLSDMIRTGPFQVPKPVDFQNPQTNKENENEIQTELTGNTQYITKLDGQGVDEMIADEAEDYSEGQDTNPNLGHIINLPLRHNPESDWYMRFARSLNQTNVDELDKLLLAEKEVINQLKRDAKHDEDLMMIGYIGENMIRDLEKRKNETKRRKREIGRTASNLPLKSLFVDPRATLDIPKTLDNIGAVAKNALEHENAPLYHVTNVVGSAQDAMMATMKIPPRNIFIPSQYDIVNREQNNALGDVNPEESTNGTPDTFQMVGSAIRNGVQSGQEALVHVGDMTKHAKNTIYNTRYIAPRLMSHKIPVVTKEPRKLIFITPRIFDVADEEKVRGMENRRDRLVKFGHIMDALGISNPNSDEVTFEKITMTPKGDLSILPVQSRLIKKIQDSLDVDSENHKDEDEEAQVVDTMSMLGKMKDSVGADNLKDFFSKVKRSLEGVSVAPQQKLEPNYHTRYQTGQVINMPNPYTIDEERISDYRDGYLQNTAENQWDQNQEILAQNMFPENLEHPFMGHFKKYDVHKLRNPNEENLGPILGAINPLMFEKLFNESLMVRSSADTPHSLFHQHERSNGESKEDFEGEKLANTMRLTDPMLKPFMGLAAMDDVPHEHVLDFQGMEGELDEDNHKNKVPEWMDGPIEDDLDYDE